MERERALTRKIDSVLIKKMGDGEKRSYRRKLTEEKRLGNEGAKPRAAAFTIHFHGWLAQTPKIPPRLWTWVFRYLFSNTWWHRIRLVFNSSSASVPYIRTEAAYWDRNKINKSDGWIRRMLVNESQQLAKAPSGLSAVCMLEAFAK